MTRTDDLGPRTRRVMALFGVRGDDGHLGVDDAPRRAEAVRAAIVADNASARPPLVLIEGPSGVGKTSLLRALGADGPSAFTRSERRRRVLEVFSRRASDAVVLGALSACGLADARAIVRRVCELSAGQQARALIALRLHRARGGPVLIDEFASGLDTPTARTLSGTLARWRDRGLPAPLVLATSHADIVERPLNPDVVVRLRDSGDGFCIERRADTTRPTSPLGRVRIDVGTVADYLALAPLHYRGGRPATMVRVLTARGGAGGREVLGVLVVSMPTLNGRWREQAWPGRYSGRSAGERRDGVRRLNREVRCIARVIVDPRARGVGLGTRLVRAYLRDPLTPRTEAVAASGVMCPMFERAGMTRYTLAPSVRDARLADALEHVGMSVHDLARADVAGVILRRPLLARELRLWAESSRATRGVSDDVVASAHAAWAALGAPGIAYCASVTN